MPNRVFLFLLFLFAGPYCYATDFQSLSGAQQDALMELRLELNQVKALYKQGSIPKKLLAPVEEYFIRKYQSQQLADLSMAEIGKLLRQCQTDKHCKRRSIIADMQGFFTFVNVMWFIGIALLLLGFGTLLYLYRRLWIRLLHPIRRLWRFILSFFPVIWRWLQSVPISIYELLLALFGFILMFNNWGGNTSRGYIALTGAFIFLASLILAVRLHEDKIQAIWEKIRNRLIRNPITLLSIMVFLVWSVTAVYQNSQVVGLFAVMALMSCLGFTVMVDRLVYFFGFKRYRHIPRTVIAAFLLIVLYGLAQIGQFHLGPLAVFQTGVFYVATPVYFIGMLIISSSYFYDGFDRKYTLLQLLTIISGIGALYVGSVYDLGAIRGFGGSFFFLYLLEKYAELPWNRKKLAWPIFILGALLFAMAYVINEYPEYFFML